MLDLTTETLVPLKTMFRLRNGQKAVFTRYDGAAGPTQIGYHCSTLGGEKSFWINWGGSLRNGERSDDIVAIAKPRVLQPGDTVRVTGLIHCPNVSVISDHCIVDMMVNIRARVRNGGPNIPETWDFNSSHAGGGNYVWWVDRRNLTFIRRGP